MRFFHLELEPRSVLGNTAVADESIISFSCDRNNVGLQMLLTCVESTALKLQASNSETTVDFLPRQHQTPSEFWK